MRCSENATKINNDKTFVYHNKCGTDDYKKKSRGGPIQVCEEHVKFLNASLPKVLQGQGMEIFIKRFMQKNKDCVQRVQQAYDKAQHRRKKRSKKVTSNS